MMHLLAGISRTTTGINPQHYSFYIIIVSQRIDFLHHFFTYNPISGFIGNISLSIENSHLVGCHLLIELRQTGGSQQGIIFGTGQFSEHRLHILHVAERINEAGCHVICLRLEGHIAVGQHIKRVNGDATRSTHSFQFFSPYIIEQYRVLKSVGIRHFGKNIRLNGRLKRTDFHHLHLYTEFLQQTRIEIQRNGKTMPVD